MFFVFINHRKTQIEIGGFLKTRIQSLKKTAGVRRGEAGGVLVWSEPGTVGWNARRRKRGAGISYTKGGDLTKMEGQVDRYLSWQRKGVKVGILRSPNIVVSKNRLIYNRVCF